MTVVSLCIIGLTCLIAVFAYPLAPDNPPDSSRIIPELSARPAGFSGLFLLQPKQQPAIHKSFLARLFTGTPATHDLILINSFFFARDSIIVGCYINAGRVDTRSFSIKSLLPPAMQRLPTGRQQMAVFDDAITRRRFLLGTDGAGRDVLSRLIVGTRISLSAGIVAVLLSLSIGILLGVISGYYRGRADNLVMYLVNIFTAVPNFLLAFAMTLVPGKGLLPLSIAIGLSMCAGAARTIRGQVLAVSELEYVQAAKILGLSDRQIIVRHILPNIAGSLSALAASAFAGAILMEAGLSFLGIGVQPPVPSWGLMMREHFLLANRPAAVIIPGIAITVLAGAFYVLGNALRDVAEAREIALNDALT